MSALDAVPGWAAIPAALLVVAGATLALIGSVGLLRMRNFYERVHTPTLGTSLGVVCILLASALVHSASGGRWVVHEVLILVFVVVTTPVTLMLLARAALHRDRAEGRTPERDAVDGTKQG